jgi:hypothetical protein
MPSFLSRRIAGPYRAVHRSTRLAWLALALGALGSAHGAIQFDVFLGYGGQPTGADGLVREAGWFTVGCEIQNDGPSFNATFELSPAGRGRGQQVRRFALELPTNTRKRFTIPAFVGAGYGSAWDAQLLDERGRVRAEKTGLRPRTLAWETFLLGAVPRSFGGLPRLPELLVNNKSSNVQPLVARLPVEQVPDNAIALEGLDALYLNSEKAIELKQGQAEAVVTWVQAGGHLIVGIEQPADLNAALWLQSLLPCQFRDTVTRKASREIEDWLRRVREDDAVGDRGGGPMASVPKYKPPGAQPYRTAGVVESPYAALTLDREFGITDFPVATGRLRDGQVLVSVQNTPLVIRAARGRGLVTVLTFSPEREPFRSWKQREWLWARLAQLPTGWFTTQPLNAWGGASVDGVFGSMIDSRQVRKLPVRWLLLLLAVYLIVIGPLDQYWLRRLKRQMLTWITFPAYVVLFSVLIYYIGYRLRAGETEWNELHIVDLLPGGQEVAWRGRTYASIYSPVNETYRLASDLPQATVRGEFVGASSGGQESGRWTVEQLGQGFRAEVFVPVWTSQLLNSEWIQSDTMPFTASIVPQGATFQVRVTNLLTRPLTDLRLVMQDRLYLLGNLPARGAVDQVLEPQASEPLAAFVQRHASGWHAILDKRQQAFGENATWPGANSTNVTAASFLSQLPASAPNQRQFLAPAGLDLGPLVERGDAVFLAWDPGHAPVPSFKRFPTVRSQQNTLYRLAIPLGSAGAF